MSKKIVAKIVSLANALDNAGNHTEADVLTRVAASVANVKVAQSDEWNTEDMGYCPDCGEWIGDSEQCEDCGWGMDNDSFDDEDLELKDPHAWQYDKDEDFPVEYDEMMAELSKRPKSGPYSGLEDNEVDEGWWLQNESEYTIFMLTWS